MREELKTLKRYFGFDSFRENQKDVIDKISKGRDVLALMPTGGGKSLCFQVPALSREGVCIVISPIISLMHDQVQELRRKGVKASVLNSTLDPMEQKDVIKKMINEEIKFIYISPERLKSFDFIEAMKVSNITLIAIDEAHCISQWGHEFRPEYARIDTYIKSVEYSSQFKNGRIQKIALTATANPEVREEIVSLSGLHNPDIIVKGFDRENLSFHVHTDESKKDKLFTLVRKNINSPTIVYCSSRKKVDKTYQTLINQGLSVGRYHGGMSKQDREYNQDQFLNDKTTLLVATNAFGMGVDKPNVRLVIHYDMPDTIEGYYQEAGRAGRDSKPSECHLLYSPYDRRLHEFLMDASLPPKHIIKELYSIIKNWEDYIFNPSIDSLKMVIPSLKESMLGSAFRYLEEAGIINITHIVENNATVPVAEIVNKNADIETILDKISERRIHKMRSIEVMERYCSGNTCLRNYMLNYFGEKKNSPCGRCSSCLIHYESLKDKTDFTKEAISAINIIKDLNSKKIDIRKETLIKLLNGDIEVSVLNMRGHLLDNFGDTSFLGNDKTVSLVSYLKDEQYISDFGSPDGYLYSTNKGGKVLNGEKFVYIKESKNGNNKKKKDNKTILKDIEELQNSLSDELHVSKFMIWTQATTKELIEKKPTNIDDLKEMKTLKDKKIEMFGDRIIEIFKRS